MDAYATDNRIEFKNGSTIEFVVPSKSNTIRGKRSKLPMLLYDYEYYDNEEVDKVL